jgi:hypothetical protein
VADESILQQFEELGTWNQGDHRRPRQPPDAQIVKFREDPEMSQF